MFRPPTKYSEYLQDVRKSIDYILKRVNATTVTQIVAGTNVTISPASGTGVVTINASGGGGGGLPAGGTTGQILAKINNVDYNAEWIDNYALWTSTVKHEVKAGEAINKGQAVYVSSADGTNMIVSKASNALEATSSKTLGILAQSLAHNAKGFVITEGLLAGLDTSAAGAAGDPVWLGTDGNLLFGLANKPYAPANMVSIGVVTRKNSSNGEIFIRIQNGFELDELHNVDARNPNNNDGIFYNSTTQLWEHKPVSAVYATPTLAQVTTAGNTTTNAIEFSALNTRVSFLNPELGTRLNGIHWANGTNTVSYAYLALSGSSGEFKIFSNASYFPTFYSNGSEAMRIPTSRNVLIGTTTDAGYKLDVNGSIRSIGNSRFVGSGGSILGTNSNNAGAIFYQNGFNGTLAISGYSNGGAELQTYQNGGISLGGSLILQRQSGSVLIGTANENAKLVVAGSITAASALAQGVYFNNTLVAAANNDVLVGLDINPTFTNGAFTGVQNLGLRVYNGFNLLSQGNGHFLSAVSTTGIDGTLIFRRNAGNNGAIRLQLGGSFLLTSNDSTGEVQMSYGNGYFLTVLANGTEAMRIPATRNVLIGTTTDAGAKVQIKGSGNTSATTSLLVQNSSGTNALKIADDALSFYYGTFGVVQQHFYSNNGSGAKRWSDSYSIIDYTRGYGDSFLIYGGHTANYTFEIKDGFWTKVRYPLCVSTSFNIPNASAILQADSTTQGFLQPRMTNAQALAITTPATGLQVYDTTNNKNLLYNGTAWQNIAIETWLTSGSNIYYNTGNVGIGTPTPTDKFHIVDNTNGNKFGRISAGGTDASAAWVAQNDQVDNVVYRVFGSAVTGTQMGISLARSASLMANLGGSGKFLVGTFSATDFVMGTGNQERMRLVDSTGNFLVGTTTDLGNKLEVSGTINATAYKINNTAGYTGILNIPTNPPGQQNIDIQSGIVVNIF